MCAGVIFGQSLASGNTARDSFRKALPFTGPLGSVVGNQIDSTKRRKNKKERKQVSSQA